MGWRSIWEQAQREVYLLRALPTSKSTSMETNSSADAVRLDGADDDTREQHQQQQQVGQASVSYRAARSVSEVVGAAVGGVVAVGPNARAKQTTTTLTPRRCDTDDKDATVRRSVAAVTVETPTRTNDYRTTAGAVKLHGSLASLDLDSDEEEEQGEEEERRLINGDLLVGCCDTTDRASSSCSGSVIESYMLARLAVADYHRSVCMQRFVPVTDGDARHHPYNHHGWMAPPSMDTGLSSGFAYDSDSLASDSMHIHTMPNGVNSSEDVATSMILRKVLFDWG